LRRLHLGRPDKHRDKGTPDETFLSAKHQSCVSQAVTIGALTGEFQHEEAAKRHNDAMLLAVLRSDARAFPLSSSMPELPLKIPDQIIDFYAFVFCQGGFRNLGLTFEQFLAVISVVKFRELWPTNP
jgi:hypothetical protein